MNDSSPVGRRQSACDLSSHLRRFHNGRRAPAQSLRQRFSFDEFACDKDSAIRLADFMYDHNVRVIQGRGCTCFALEPAHALGVVLELDGQQFQCNLASQLQVFGQVDFSHRSVTERPEDAEVPEEATGKWLAG